MKKMKGFTLIELLAVIILLGLISSIIAPSILKTINSSNEKAFEVSAKNLIDAAQNYVADSDFETWPSSGYSISYIISNNLFSAENLDKFTSGTVYCSSSGTISIEYITDGNYCASGTKNDLYVTTGNCSQ